MSTQAIPGFPPPLFKFMKMLWGSGFVNVMWMTAMYLLPEEILGEAKEKVCRLGFVPREDMLIDVVELAIRVDRLAQPVPGVGKRAIAPVVE